MYLFSVIVQGLLLTLAVLENAVRSSLWSDFQIVLHPQH